MTTFRSARALRRGALALTLGLGLVASACAPEPTPPTPNQAAAHNAGVWMNAQFTAGHAFPGPFGGESAVSAAEAIADLDALGVGQAQQADRLARLEADTPTAITDGTNDVPGNLARIILAVVATGGNPRAFAGLDLVARLEATVGVDGRFGAQSPLYDGVYRQGLALAALSVVTPRPASITPGAGQSLADLPAVAWLADQQCADGSWMAYRADTSAPCVEDPATWTYKDSNAAAMATLGLTAIGATAPVDPTTWFQSVRGTDGGWGAFPPASTTPSDADSTGLVIAALEALGHVPDDTAYAKLRSFQILEPAPVADRGAFVYQWPWDASPAVPSIMAMFDSVTALFDETWPQALVP
ncbi:MAG TPA: hypothetical protein P5193_05755 [Microthrixaceae bacterium]|nr:hypothetical protein [Microthrixaceae bacterium]